jgi:hypothetical protein
MRCPDVQNRTPTNTVDVLGATIHHELFAEGVIDNIVGVVAVHPVKTYIAREVPVEAVVRTDDVNAVHAEVAHDVAVAALEFLWHVKQGTRLWRGVL